MSGLPSIRECELGLASLATAPVAEHNLKLAVQIGRALLHYVRNAGTQASTPPTLKSRAQSLPVYSRPSSPAPHLMRRPDPMPSARRESAVAVPAPAPVPSTNAGAKPKAKRNIKPFVPPPGMVTIKQLSERSGFSPSFISVLILAGTVEKAEQPGRAQYPALWSEAQAERICELLADRTRRTRHLPKITPLPIPADWVSVEQFAQRLGDISTQRVHNLVHSRHLPRADYSQGRRVYWAEATVAATVAERKKASQP